MKNNLLILDHKCLIKQIKLKLILLLSLVTISLYSQNPIITKWYPNGLSIKIPTIGSFNYTYEYSSDPTINGSGTGVSGVNTITLPKSQGLYIVKIYPISSFKFNFGNPTITYEEKQKLFEISQWGNVNWYSDLSMMFSGCNQMKITATDIPNFSNVSSFYFTFSGCLNISTIPNINAWDTSNVTDMAFMFNACHLFNSDISNWNTSKVIKMNSMFMNANAFNQNISSWNVSNVSDFSAMFWEAYSFNQNLGSWKLKVGPYSMLYKSGLSCDNYAKTLKGWFENSTTPSNTQLTANDLIYGNFGQEYRNLLINQKNWTISGDFYDSNCNETLSISEINKSINIYPNPSNGIFYLDTEKDMTINIYNVSGTLLKTIDAKRGSNKINISNYPKGVYFINNKKIILE